MSYLTCFFALVIAVASFCTADDDDLIECEDVGSVGMPRATLMSAISGIAGIPGIAAPSIYQAGNLFF